MIVALHTAPKGFFKTIPPHSTDELAEFVQKAASLGFKAVQIGPLSEYVSIDAHRLRIVLYGLNMKRSVHVGGLYDSEKFVLTEEEFSRMKKGIRYGIMLSKKIGSASVSIHPPFFKSKVEANKEILPKAKNLFRELVKEQADFATTNHVKLALESFCYYPFIFEGLHDFAHFVSNFSSDKLGVLLDIGHLYQIGINISEAINLFKHRLTDIHVHDATHEKDYKKATHLPIEKGTINFPEVIDCLQKVRYDGWLTLEIRASEREIIKSKTFLDQLIKEKS